MRSLLPHPDDVGDIAGAIAIEARPTDGGPWVVANMVASVDGAITVEGRSGGLGGPGDRAVFRALRAAADVVLVGAGTVRAENYGPPRLDPALRRLRVRSGRHPLPRLAVLSGSLNLEPGSRLFEDGHRPLVLTLATAPPDRRERLGEVADIVEVGDEHLDVSRLLSSLAPAGAGVVLCEGGPTLNGHLVEAGALDELCLTISPVVAGGDAARVVAGSTPRAAVLRLARLWEEDGFLFARYLVDRPAR